MTNLGNRPDNGTTTTSTTPKSGLEQKLSPAAIVTICVGLALFVGAFGWLIDASEKQGDKIPTSTIIEGTKETPTPQPTQVPRTIVYRPGEAVCIVAGTGAVVIVATSEENAKALHTAYMADDDVGIRNLQYDDGTFRVPAETKAKVLDDDVSLFSAIYVHVRIVDGDYAERDGWVESTFLRPR